MGVVVRRYIDILTIIINFTYSTCISSFLAAASQILCSFLKCFFILYIYKEQKNIFKMSNEVGMLLQKGANASGVGINNMRHMPPYNNTH